MAKKDRFQQNHSAKEMINIQKMRQYSSFGSTSRLLKYQGSKIVLSNWFTVVQYQLYDLNKVLHYSRTRRHG